MSPMNAPRAMRLHTSIRGVIANAQPLWSVLALVALVLALNVVLPGLPGADRGLTGRLTALMAGICPQRPSHSYTLGGVQLPLEARIMGMFGGLLAGVVELAVVAGRRRIACWPRPQVALTLAFGLGIMAFDGTNAFFFDLGLPHAYTPDLRVRLGTGMLAGVAMAFALVPIAAQTAAGPDAAEVLGPAPGWRDAGSALLAGSAFALLVASRRAALLAPVALVGSGGVLLGLTLINRTVLAGLFLLLAGGRAGAAGVITGWQATPMLDAAAAMAAIAELIALALLRAAVLPLG